MYKSIAISSGHSTKCQGAVGPSPWGLNEVAEATKVVNRVAEELKNRGVKVEKFHDTVSTTQNENLNRIVDWHNSKVRQLDISCHFNASKPTSNPVGTEVWYVSQKDLAAKLSAAMAKSGLKDRGAKYSNNLFFLNGTAMPSVLLEVVFVDSEADVKIYKDNFDKICNDITISLSGDEAISKPPVKPEPVPPSALFYAIGTCSHFGGPNDQGVSPSEGLAFIYNYDDAPWLFLANQPSGSTGLARRLDPSVFYIACRWDYSKTPKPSLLENLALVRATKTGVERLAHPADWGPHEEKTGRAADLSPGLMASLGITTDDEVEVIYPAPGDEA